jgi:hypothetical protein
MAVQYFAQCFNASETTQEKMDKQDLG